MVITHLSPEKTRHETHLSTFPHPTHPHPRVSATNEHKQRRRRVEPTSPEGTRSSRSNKLQEVSFGHPREARLRRRRDFTRAQRLGARQHGSVLTLVLAPSDTARARFGTAVSRRVGNAVVRNRLRRLLKEVFRHNAAQWPAFDYLVIAKPELATLAASGYRAVEAVLVGAVERAIERETRRAR